MKLLLILLSLALPSYAQTNDQIRFRGLFFDEVKTHFPGISQIELQDLHFVGDEIVHKALQSGTVYSSLSILGTTNLARQSQVSATAPTIELSKKRKRPLTMVIVPGLVAEFIQNRAFEEVLSPFSTEYLAFQNLVKEKNVKDHVAYLGLYRRGGSEEEIAKPVPLDQLLALGNLDIGENRVRVLLFGTLLGSLETLGRPEDTATIFKRRLEKYLELTGPQDIAFVGYSRGTSIALEMMTQAQAEKKAWLGDVKGMISLSGVVWGSALADDFIYEPSSPMFQLLASLKKLSEDLLEVPNLDDFSEASGIVIQNSKLWRDFLFQASGTLSGMGPPSVDLSVSRLDPRGMLNVASKMWRNLALNRPLSGYNQSIRRFRYLISEMREAIEGLTTKARLQWFKTHTLPRGVIYYALPGVMANPDTDAIEARLFKNRYSYGEDGMDRQLMLHDLKTYKELTGVSLSDAQVSVVQSAFLPNVLSTLNPANTALDIKFLGMVGTHHWGIALKKVNPQLFSDGNGFPRTALLRALSRQVMLDNP